MFYSTSFSLALVKKKKTSSFHSSRFFCSHRPCYQLAHSTGSILLTACARLACEKAMLGKSCVLPLGMCGGILMIVGA